jgi:hypothetical protein
LGSTLSFKRKGGKRLFKKKVKRKISRERGGKRIFKKEVIFSHAMVKPDPNPLRRRGSKRFSIKLIRRKRKAIFSLAPATVYNGVIDFLS